MATSAKISKKDISPTNIHVLSYNVCWGCMSANESSENNRTAEPLATRCRDEKKSTGQNVCLNNVVSIIKNAQPIDFLGLQEASGWHEIYEKLKFPHLGFIHHTISLSFGDVEMATFYNTEKFKLLAFKVGNLVFPRGKEDGRPYQILFLQKKDSGNYFIVINVHCGHRNNDSASLQELLSQDITNLVDCTDTKEIHFENAQTKDLSDCSDLLENEYHIIFMGDTNDHGKTNLWKGFNPFNISPLNKKIKSDNEPPRTCCLISRYPPYSHYGDYILISNNLEYLHENIVPEHNMNYDYDESNVSYSGMSDLPASDHFPVLSIIREKHMKSKHGGGRKKQTKKRYKRTSRLKQKQI